MQVKSDIQLLREYAEHGTEAAFTEIVTRNTNFVYSAALRQLDSPDIAAEVAQTVFIGLAKKARSLSARLAGDASLAGWLCRSARNISLNHRRDEFRQHSRERLAMEDLIPLSETAPDWERLRPVLDDAMSELAEADYDALVMRFFKDQDLRSVGTALGVSDDTAQKRVSRALDKLRKYLALRGITTTGAALSIVLSTNAVQAAPAGLAVTISTAVTLAGTVASTSTAITTTKAIFMTTIHKTFITATIAATVGMGIYEVRRAAHFQEQAQALQQQQHSLAIENQQLRQERDDAANRLAAVQQASIRPSGNTSELLRLRGEVARLRENARELAQLKAAAAATGNDSAIEATLKSWATRAAQLKQRLEQMPDKKIPELQLLSDKDWLDAIKEPKQLDTDADFRQGLKNLRDSAKTAFGDMAREALKKYADANNGQLPTDLSQLNPYFQTPVDDATLQRYSLLQTGKLGDVPVGQAVFAEKAPPVDNEYDSAYEFTMNGLTSWDVNNPGDIVGRAAIDFAKAHGGLLPTDASQLAPYLKRPVDAATVQSFMGKFPPGITTLDQLNALH
jgi:RNA polymerase sigma factor (sigma-70 family)